MKFDHWRTRIITGAVVCMLALAGASCGGGGGVQLAENAADRGAVGAEVSRGAGLLTITEDQIGSLPQWQQDLLSDPGWDQPPIPQRADTPMPAPSHEMLMEHFAAQQAAGLDLAPRGLEGAGKGASWNDPDNYIPPASVNRGEYEANHGTVPYGCEDASLTNGHSKERNIAVVNIPNEANQVRSYVEQGISSPNHFNTTGGSGNDEFSAVYQLFASSRSADPEQSYEEYVEDGGQIPVFAEVSYRADGGPAASGDPCDPAAEAFLVRGFYWWRFNSNTNALPGGNSTPWYNILIAPAGPLSSEETSDFGTDAQMQAFYLGNVNGCFGGSAIVGLNSTSSSCAKFAELVNEPANAYFFTNPIHGVLLQRWQHSAGFATDPGSDPWEGDFGWPVQGPVAYNNGAQVLTGNGAYYAWGMYFEKGFVWWIDYANNASVPDEAQAYLYTGTNVYCAAANAAYEKQPTIFYGGSGALGVSVVVEASLNPDRGPGTPPAGSYYEVTNPATPNPPTLLNMHAHGYGGTPQAGDCAYKHYTWAFRDGSLGVSNGNPFDNSTQFVSHAYTYESIYTVRVQVVDASDNIAYGDSLPIHVGSGSSGGAGEIWLIRADDNNGDSTYGDYPTNADALKASLDAMGASYTELDFSSTVAADFEADATARLALFYHGGPGANGETNNTSTLDEDVLDAMLAILNSGSKRRVLFMSQAHQTDNYTEPGWTNYWQAAYGAVRVNGVMANKAKLDGQIGGFDVANFFGVFSFPLYVSSFSNTWQAAGMTGAFGQFSNLAAERFNGAGSSGKVPIAFSWSGNRQFTTRGRYTFFDSSFPGQINTNFQNGIVGQVDPNGGGTGFFGSACLSWGNLINAPGIGGGSGKYWVWATSFGDMTVTAGSGAPNKDDVLRNVLANLDGGLTFAAKTNQGFNEYGGAPQIVSVTPAFWDEVGFDYRAGASAVTWDGTSGNYPDQTMADVYRSTDTGAYSNEIVTTDPNNDWINGNDVDFAFPWYAYVDNGGNNVVEFGAANIGTTDDAVSYGGLLLDDADGSWARITPPAMPNDIPSIMLAEDQNAVPGRTPMPVVAGYYDGGDTGDEVRASYGTQPDSFSAAGIDFDNSSRLTVETIARWPESLRYFDFAPFPASSDPSLFWSVYPGQGTEIPSGPDAGKFVGINVDWDAYRRSFDVDPSFAAAGRTGKFNRPPFSFTNSTNNGRVIEFNLRSVTNWNPDLNRDNVIDVNDKFPVRVRLFTNHQAYFNKTQSAGSVWPNHLHDLGLDPAFNPPGSLGESAIEGGCYIVDKGQAVYVLRVDDNTAVDDPGQNGNIAGGPGAYTMDIGYEIFFGNPNYTVELDTWYDGTFQATAGVPIVNMTPQASPGPKVETVNIPANQPDNDYTFAIRVTDSNNDSDIYVWPNQVTLAPQFTVVILQDPLTQLVGGQNRAVQNLQNDLNFLYGSSTVINLGTTTLTPGSLDGADGIFWCSDIAFANTGGTGSIAMPYGYTKGAGNANITEVMNQVKNNGKSLLLFGGGAFGFSFWGDTPFWTDMPIASQTWWFDGPTGWFHKHVNYAATIPNSVGGWDNWQASSLGPANRQTQNFGSPQGGATWTVEGFFNNAEFGSFGNGANRINLGPGLGKVSQVCFNYGDMAATQGALYGNSQPRHKYLENLMCFGSFASPFNSTATP